MSKGFSAPVGHFGRSSSNLKLNGYNGVAGPFEKRYFTTTQVKYVEMFMDLVSFGVDFGMVGDAHDYVL